MANTNNTVTAYTALTGYSSVPTDVAGVEVEHFYRDITPIDIELTGTFTHKLVVNNGYDTNTSTDTADYNWAIVEDNTIIGSINSINANKEQPRKIFREADLLELSKSIKENGVIQPLIVTED